MISMLKYRNSTGFLEIFVDDCVHSVYISIKLLKQNKKMKCNCNLPVCKKQK